MKKVLLIIFVILTLIAAGLGVRNLLAANWVSSPPPGAIAQWDPANSVPDLALQDWNGNTVSLSGFAGKPVILNFWASWCGPCQGEMPDFEAAYQKYGSDVHFVIVNLADGSWETVDSGKAFIRDQGYSFPVYFDTANASTVYGVEAIPTTFFISPSGQLVDSNTGMLSGQALESFIARLLASK